MRNFQNSYCSDIQLIFFYSLDELLSDIASVIEGDLCHPVVVKTLKKFLPADGTKISHPLNVLRTLCSLERDELEVS